MANKRYELRDEQCERVKELIVHSKMGRPPKDDRVMLNAMLWMARGGADWKDNKNSCDCGRAGKSALLSAVGGKRQ